MVGMDIMKNGQESKKEQRKVTMNQIPELRECPRCGSWHSGDKDICYVCEGREVEG